ncbi:hypothetical protein LPJ78_001986 [Coemansia sp. RSA 989]|nr:hypothetical protein LPJ78_001986 [Coemansia sp. RSA 989]KAJ1874408.1 hypothetical protein LPJ55_001527 [Coemansia sp. RSA 990]KAJ2672856.1 hypothetical protein IWW42_002629 [Coemansia sp. RSA 1085]
MTSGHKIKVVCRVRPFLQAEAPDESVTVESSSLLRVTNPRDSSKDVKFNFDSCYGPDIGQEAIYKNDVRPLVETVFNGLSATVFCYGVTGAGKTHTIQGTESEPGIIPRAMEHIFRHQQRDAFDYDIRVSYYEIYKEAVFDLLRSRDTMPPAGLPIREDANRRIFIAGLSEKKVTSYEQFEQLYQKACRNRRTASTKLNNHSSRSHAILTVQVKWKDDIGAGKTWCGRLHLIDLAGSEDNRRTENGKDRMAESSAINRSLFVLGQVVEALNTGALRIPYRDSKMTRILQDSLGGESLGMMIVNVAPGEAFLQETHNTLSFATKSREVVNKPVAHEVVEQRWTIADRLQHHRGAMLPTRSALMPTTLGNGGVKRRRSDEPSVDYEYSPAGSTKSDGVLDVDIAKRRRAKPAGRHSDSVAINTASAASKASNGQLGMRRSASAFSRPDDLAQRASAMKVNDTDPRADAANNEIMERVLRIEEQLSSKQLDTNMVFDLFTPGTKLKTSRGWLKYARELEQKGELEKALVHYEEALRYAPELNKLGTHIAKLKAKIRRQKRRSSIASHGAANVRVSDQKGNTCLLATDAHETASDDEDVGPLWMADGLAESPGAEKAKRNSHANKVRNAAASQPAKPLVATSKPADKPNIKRRRILGTNGLKKTSLASKCSITEGSVHDRRISFGTNQLNPFVVDGNDFNSELQRKLDERRKPVSLGTKKLISKSVAAARLRKTALEPPPTPDDRNDKDFVPPSDGHSSSDDEVLGLGMQAKKNKRGARLPGSLSVRDMIERRRQAESSHVSEKPSSVSASNVSKPHKTSSSTTEPKLQLDQFNDISIASALQMINSAEVKKITKLQGIGKRRAEQIQASIQEHGPIKHVSELQTRLQFKNKIIIGILSTFA